LTVAQQINLFNPVFLKQKRYFSAVAMAQALALIVAGVLVIYGFQVYQTRTLERVAAQTEKQVAERTAQFAGLAKQTAGPGASKALAAELESAEARLADRRSLLDDVRTGVGGDASGYARYLVGFARASTGGVWLTGVKIGGKSAELTIMGRALESALVPAYIASLNRQESFAGRRVAALRIASKTEARAAETPPTNAGPARYVEFSISMPLREDAP